MMPGPGMRPMMPGAMPGGPMKQGGGMGPMDMMGPGPMGPGGPMGGPMGPGGPMGGPMGPGGPMQGPMGPIDGDGNNLDGNMAQSSLSSTSRT